MITYQKELGSSQEEFLNEHFIPDRPSLLKMAGFSDNDQECRPLSNPGEQSVSLGLFKIGKCLPRVCTEQDVSNGASNFMMDLLGDDILSRGVTLSCHSDDDEVEWTAGDWVKIGRAHV